MKNSPGYSMAWWAVFMAVLFMPLAGVAIEVPRYYLFRSHLQRTADAVAETAAYFGFDAVGFINSGNTRIDPHMAYQIALSTLASNIGWLGTQGYLTGYSINITQREVMVELEGRMRLFITGVPSFPIRVRSTAQIRVVVR